MVGKTLGNLKIISKIGQGGMGVVYLAEHITLRKKFAVKSLVAEMTKNPGFRDRFQQEAVNHALLDHPNIVQATDFFEEDGEFFFVMEYVKGHGLNELIQKPAKLSEKEILQIFKGILKGLNFAHSKGLIHRDIKPSNVIIDESGRARITDFGIAILEGDKRLTASSTNVGSAWYMSPEQILHPKDIDHRSDVYSAGIVLYEMLTGEIPFDGETEYSVKNQQVTGVVPDPTKKNPNIPPQLKKLLLKALKKDPDARFSGCGDFLREIETYEAQLGFTKSKSKFWPKLSSIFSWLEGSAEPEQPQINNAKLKSNRNPDISQKTVIRPYRAEPKSNNEENFKQRIDAHDATMFFQDEISSVLPKVALTITHSAIPSLLGKRISLTHFPFRIGRDEAADYVITNDIAVSKSHIILDYDKRAFTVQDAGSSNGSYINGRQLTPEKPETLFFRDIISLSNTTTMAFIPEDLLALPDLTGNILKANDKVYKLKKNLHSSMKAAIYSGYDQKFDRNVAVKVFSPQLSAISSYMEQFESEAKTAGRLSHHHICRILDFGKASVDLSNTKLKQIPYLCMELMDGGSLADWIKEKKPISLNQVVDWINKLGNALQYVHNQTVIHQGIKPTSIVFDRENNPYLTDFAIASRPSDKTSTAMMGAPSYLAPEQWKGDQISPATDQYSLAVLAYFLVTGSKPYAGQENPEVRRRNFRLGPIPAHNEAEQNGRPGISTVVSKVFARALATNSKDRYPSVLEFARSFETAVMNPSISDKTEPRIFISYHRESSAGWANLLSSEFKNKHACSPFIDTQQFETAVPFPKNLKNKIEECDIFVCLLADKTLDSKWIKDEIRLAIEFQKPMIPVFLDSFSKSKISGDIEPYVEELLNYQGVPLYDKNNPDLSHTIAVLAKMVKQTIEKC